MRRHTRAFAKALGVVGLINVQYAVRDDTVYVIEVNPRGSRTVPFVSKATGVPLAKVAAGVAMGMSLDELGVSDEVHLPYVAVKEAVFPFSKLPNVDTLLGPEMRSTGEVMGIAESFGMAFAKAQIGAEGALPLEGAVFVTVNDNDKATVLPIIQRLCELGFKIYATSGTAAYLRDKGIPISEVLKIHEGRPNARDLMVSGTVDLLINTPLGKLTQRDDYEIRRTALQLRLPYITTLSAARAACDAIFAMRRGEPTVRCLQEWHKEIRAAGAVPQDSGAVAG
jgi:carbamoyl-phosphate synthase large subunit